MSGYAQQSSSTNAAGGAGPGGAIGTGDLSSGGDKPVQYICGECAKKVLLKRDSPIRCDDCGFRVLYKERTNRMVQFEAR